MSFIYYVNEIHNWVNENIAGFTGMDYQVTVNMDETGMCNASFGGGQMNFFLQGGGRDQIYSHKVNLLR